MWIIQGATIDFLQALYGFPDSRLLVTCSAPAVLTATPPQSHILNFTGLAN